MFLVNLFEIDISPSSINASMNYPMQSTCSVQKILGNYYVFQNSERYRRILPDSTKSTGEVRASVRTTIRWSTASSALSDRRFWEVVSLVLVILILAIDRRKFLKVHKIILKTSKCQITMIMARKIIYRNIKLIFNSFR